MAGLTFNPDAALMLFDRQLAKSQTQSGAVRRTLTADPREFFKNVRLIFECNTFALIFDADDDVAVGIGIGIQHDLSAGRCVRDGVA